MRSNSWKWASSALVSLPSFVFFVGAFLATFFFLLTTTIACLSKHFTDVELKPVVYHMSGAVYSISDASRKQFPHPPQQANKT
jgi:hypothetical protein